MKATLSFRLRRGACLLSLVLLLAGMAGGQNRVVAIPDVHGGYQEFLSVLTRTELIDKEHNWAGGSASLVQLGDVLDRGPKPRDAMDLLMALETQAPKQNGKVICLLGNHEVMNMMGDLRYVTAEEYGQYATADSEKVRAAAWQDYWKFLGGRKGRGKPSEEEQAKWMEAHPLGYFEQRDAFGPKGAYGKWLRKHDSVVQIGDTLFMHGGLDPKLKFKSIEDLNKKILDEVAEWDRLWQALCDRKVIWRYMSQDEALREINASVAETKERGDSATLEMMKKVFDLQNGLAVGKNGPLWYRGYFEEPEAQMQKDLDSVLSRLKAKHVAVGHTVSRSLRITPLLDNRVFQMDCGMLAAMYHGHPAALEIRDGVFTAYYGDGGDPQVLIGGKASGAAR